MIEPDHKHCATCGAELTRDGCPARLEHARALRDRFVPDPRGAPNRPGPGNQRLEHAITSVRACLVRNAESVGDVRYNHKIQFVLDELEGLR